MDLQRSLPSTLHSLLNASPSLLTKHEKFILNELQCFQKYFLAMPGLIPMWANLM